MTTDKPQPQLLPPLLFLARFIELSWSVPQSRRMSYDVKKVSPRNVLIANMISYLLIQEMKNPQLI